MREPLTGTLKNKMGRSIKRDLLTWCAPSQAESIKRALLRAIAHYMGNHAECPVCWTSTEIIKRQISQNGPIHSGNVVTLTDDYHGKVWATDGSFKTGEGVGYGMADSPQEGTTISARTDGPKTAGTGESMGIMHGVIASPDDEPFRILTDHKFSTDTIQSLLNPHEKLRGQTSNLCVYRTID